MFIEGGISHRRSAYAVQTKYLSLPVPSVQKKGNEHRTMSATKFTSGGAQTKTFGELLCAPSSGGGLHQGFTFFFSSAHSPLHESIFYEFSYPCCPSQGIFPPPAVSFRGQDVGREKIS